MDFDSGRDSLTYAAALQYAADNNLYVVVPTKTSIQVDIDGPEEQARFDDAVIILRRHFSIVSERTTISKSGKKHIHIDLGRELTDTERIAIQAALGSDGRRELLSILRVWKGEPHPSIFFEKIDIEAAAVLPIDDMPW